MRRLALVTVLCLFAAACGDDAVFESTTTTTQPGTTAATSTIAVDSTSTTAPTTTTSTIPETTTTTWETYAVPADELCVIDHLSDDALNVRSGPGGTFEVIGTLPYDATGVHATGLAADEATGQTWKQIDQDGGLGWVAGWLVTEGACSVGAAAEYCIIEPECGLSRLPVHSGPGAGYQQLGTLPWFAFPVEGTGAQATGGDGAAWQQIHFRGEVGWVPTTNLMAPPCHAVMCASRFTPPSATCTGGWGEMGLGDHRLDQALESVGVGGPSPEIAAEAFVVEDARYFTGPEDANIVSPRPEVDRVYFVGYAETDPGFRGRWLLRGTTSGFALVAVAPHNSSGFGSGVWETCVDTCQTGRPLAGEWCDTGCVEDYIFRSCEGIAPGAWIPGDCAGPPPEVLGCLEP